MTERPSTVVVFIGRTFIFGFTATDNNRKKHHVIIKQNVVGNTSLAEPHGCDKIALVHVKEIGVDGS